MNTKLLEVLDLIIEAKPELLITKDALLELSNSILNTVKCSDIVISRADATEVLLYRKDKAGNFYNIIIDSDLDVEFNIIPNVMNKDTKIPFELYMHYEDRGEEWHTELHNKFFTPYTPI